MPDLIKPGTEKNPIYAKSDEEKAEVLVDYFSSVFTIESDLNNEHRKLQETQIKKAIFLGTETNESAGNFDKYSSRCDLKNNGWFKCRH